MFPASLSVEQCVCEEGRIEDKKDLELGCFPCMVGLECPRGASRAQLSVSNNTVQDSRLLPGYNSEPVNPFLVFKCPSEKACPGGRPGNCPGTLRGRTCSECGPGRYISGSECLDCDTGVKILWIFVGIFLCVAMLSTHFMATNKFTHKATSLLCITSGFGMLVILFQNLGVLHMVSIPWPTGLNEFLRFAAIFLFRLEGMGLSCFTWNNNVWEYCATTAIWWFLLFALPALGLLTKLMPCLVSRNLDWDIPKTFSTVGQFLQVGFTTMTSLSLTPFMCYKHPNGQESILKYSSVFCGTSEHGTMRFFGGCLMALATTFLIFCCFIAVKAPGWSGTWKLTAVRFFVVRFRPDVWWFGLVLLFRGLLLSVPAVVVTDMPSIHLAVMLIVLLIGLCVQTFVLPWKAPILNLVDALSNGCFVALLSVSLAFLEVDSGEAREILQGIAIFFSCAMVLILVFMIMLSLAGVVYSLAMGNHRDAQIFNLGKGPDPQEVLTILQDIAQYVAEEGNSKSDTMLQLLDGFSIYDLDAVMRAMNLLADDLEMVINMEKTFGTRINSGRRTQRQTTFVHRLSCAMRGSTLSTKSKRSTVIRDSVAQSRRSKASIMTLNSEWNCAHRSTEVGTVMEVDEAELRAEVPEESVQKDQAQNAEEVNFGSKPRWQL